ncbi:MAG: TlpA family protein disulfide reductase [Candidatus Eiseniibacteriota bacterium]
MIRLLACFALLLAAAPAGAAGAYRAPNFRATDISGRAVTLEEYLGKGPVVVDFWATWCKPCIKELPFIQRLHDEYAKHGVQVLAVTIDSPKSQSRVRPFVKGHGFTFHVLLDGDQEVFRQLQGEGSVPYVVVLDREGFVRYRHTGYRPGDEEELEKVVREMLGPALDAPVEAAPEAAPGEAAEASSG